MPAPALNTPLANVMRQAAFKAARKLRHDFHEIEHLQVSKKGPADFVTKADVEVEKLLVQELGKARPDFGFLLEEGGTRANAMGDTSPKVRWIIDPIDGTLNFMHGIPQFAISIGVEEDGELVAGMVYDVAKDETFVAEKGRGAFMNDMRLRVSARRQLSESVIGTGIPFKGVGDHDLFIRQLSAIMPEVAGVRRMGVASLDLAYVAAGRFEAFWENGLKPWDMAAGIVLVREAGGIVTEPDNRNRMMTSGNILAGNEAMHKLIGDILRKVAMG